MSFTVSPPAALTSVYSRSCVTAEKRTSAPSTAVMPRATFTGSPC